MCACPNCHRPMFPALNLNLADERLAEFRVWHHDRLVLLFCPACFLYMKPYFIEPIGREFRIHGGYRDGGEVVQNIEIPYACKLVKLEGIVDEELAANDVVRESYLSRNLGEGVYHQLGGYPFKGVSDALTCFQCGRAMKFFGILDYDDLNVPLYEDDHRPVALIIGDYDCMNIYSCEECCLLGLKWARSG